MSEPKACKTCRYWDVHSIDALKGDCRAPGDHRYSRVTFARGTVALLDSFGPEETKPNFVCGAWARGQAYGALNIADGI